MVDDLKILDEKIYDLSSIGLENGSKLVIGPETFIETETDYFPFKRITDFKIEGNSVYIENEDNEKFYITSEQFVFLQDLIKNT